MPDFVRERIERIVFCSGKNNPLNPFQKSADSFFLPIIYYPR